MAQGKPKISTGRPPGRPRKVGRGFGKVVGSKVAKPVSTTTHNALRSGTVYISKDSAKKTGTMDKGGAASDGAPIKRGRGRPKKTVDMEMPTDGDQSDGATNGETEQAKEGGDTKVEEDFEVEGPTPEIKRGRGRPKKVVREVSTEDVHEAALATASASTKSSEAGDGSADEEAEAGPATTETKHGRGRPQKVLSEVSTSDVHEAALATASTSTKGNEAGDKSANKEAEEGPATVGPKRGRGRPKKESNLLDDLAPSSPAPATVSTVKRGKGRPPKKRRLSYFGRPVPVFSTEESVHEGGQEGDGADDSIVVNTGSEGSKASGDGDIDDTPAAAASFEANAEVPKLLPSLMPHSAGLSPSPSHGGIATARELELSQTDPDAGGRPRCHGIFKGKAGEEEKLELAPYDDADAAGSGHLTPYGYEGANGNANKVDRAVEGICILSWGSTGGATLTLNQMHSPSSPRCSGGQSCVCSAVILRSARSDCSAATRSFSHHYGCFESSDFLLWCSESRRAFRRSEVLLQQQRLDPVGMAWMEMAIGLLSSY